MTTFFGALLLPALAAGFHLGHDERSVFPWLVAAFALYLVVFIITLAVHVPLNDGIKAAGDPNHIADLAAVLVGPAHCLRAVLGARILDRGHSGPPVYDFLPPPTGRSFVSSA